MNSKKPRTPREELEASLTALLLGELSADKAAALRELMTKDAQLARLYERLEQTIGLVKETAVPAEETTQSAPLKLSSKRREQLLAHFKTIAPKEFTKPRDRTIQVRELAIAAGIVAFIGVAAWFTFNLTQQSFSSTSRISQVDVLESGPAATEIVANDMTKARPRSNVGSITEQTTARLAAETALEMEQTAIIAGSAGGSSGGIGSPSQTIFDAPSAGKPIIDQIVLPTATDYAVSATPRGMYDDQVSTFTLSDPQGVGVAERGDYTPPAYISSNAFIGRYAFSGIPTNQIELAYKTAEPALATKRADSKNSAISQETVNFEDLIREESARTNVGLISDLSDLSRKATEGFGRTGTGATYAQNGWTNGASQQVDEMLRRRAGAVAWTDNAHSKQGGVGLADSSVQQMSRSKLQEGLRNSSENKPAEKVPVIDPATGLPIPVPEFYAKLTRDDLGGIRPLTPTKPTSALALRSSAQAAQTAAASTPVDGEKLAELAQKGKDASGSNVYLGMELAKADVKFGTWGLETDQAGARPRGTKTEEESLKQMGEVRDGVTIAGRVGTPERNLRLMGPATTTPTPSSIPVESQTVEMLGDLPVLGKAFKGAEVKPGLNDSFSDSASLPIQSTNLQTWGRLLSGVIVSNASGYVHPESEWQFGTGTPNRGWLGGAGVTNMATAPGQTQSPSNIYSLEVAGYVNGSASATTNSALFAGAPPISKPFSDRLQQAGTNTASYDRYTFYRNLEQLGTDGDKEPKLALSYSNVTNEDRKKGQLSAGETREEIIPQGTIDFRGADINQVLDFYSDLTGRKILAASNLPSSTFVLPNRSMTKSEAIQTLDLMLATNGIAVVDIGDKFAKVAPVASAGQMGAAYASDTLHHSVHADVDRLREEYKIADAMAAADAPTMLMSAESLRKLDGMRLELESEVMQQETQLDALKKMPREKLVASLPTAAPDTALNSLVEQKNLIEQKLIIKQRELGESNPEVARLRGQVSDLNGKIDRQTDGILSGLDGRVTAVKEQLSKLRNEVEKAKTNDIASAKQTQPYWEAKRKLDDLQQFSQVLQMKIASENIEASLPKTTMVEIMDDAAPAEAKKTDVWDRIRGKGKYESQARIKVDRDQSDISFPTNPKNGTAYDPYFIQNEFESIKSDKVLGKVVAALNLQKEWANGGQILSTNQAIALLKQKLDLRPERNTSFVDIGVKSDKPEEAAKLANAVANSYQAHLFEIRRELSLGGIRALEGRWTEQQAKIQEAQKKVDALRASAVINETKPAASQPLTNQQIDVAPSKPAVPLPVPQPEVQTRENAFSTFSLNVSDVSFKLAAASLEKGQMPEPAGIRSEEFINAFDYRDPEAPAGVPVAFAWERARYPYAQNRDLLRFSIKTAAQGRQAGRPLNIVLLLDNSGSMERADRVAIIREALKVLASHLQPQDKLSVITFARTAQLRVDGVAGNQAAQVAEDIGGLTPEGGTNIEEAMNLAYQTALRHYLANGINRVVLLTDGAANLGNVEPESLKQKVEANRKQGVALDCFGIGWEGFNDDLLETLSRNGDGRYGFINSPEEATTEFAGQLAGALNVAASDVKVQVEFNPARVTAYRQIGYAKHQLTKEQFRDNTVDAAEIAAQEAGNALYVIEVNPAGQGPLGTVRVRFKVPGTSDYREHEWSVPFNGNAVALEQATSAMRLAASASAFSEWLASSPYATEVTPDTLLSYLGGVPEVYGADARPKKLEWMIRQAKSLAGGEIRNSNVETRSKPEESKQKDANRIQFP